MVRISKQEERRSVSHHRCRAPVKKTGPKKENLPFGYKVHDNVVQDDAVRQSTFIPKIK